MPKMGHQIRKWLVWEDELIRKMREMNCGNEEIAARLGRTRQAIKGRVATLKLPRLKGVVVRSAFVDDERPKPDPDLLALAKSMRREGPRCRCDLTPSQDGKIFEPFSKAVVCHMFTFQGGKLRLSSEGEMEVDLESHRAMKEVEGNMWVAWVFEGGGWLRLGEAYSMVEAVDLAAKLRPQARNNHRAVTTGATPDWLPKRWGNQVVKKGE